MNQDTYIVGYILLVYANSALIFLFWKSTGSVILTAGYFDIR